MFSSTLELVFRRSWKSRTTGSLTLSVFAHVLEKLNNCEISFRLGKILETGSKMACGQMRREEFGHLCPCRWGDVDHLQFALERFS